MGYRKSFWRLIGIQNMKWICVKIYLLLSLTRPFLLKIYHQNLFITFKVENVGGSIKVLP